MDKSTLSANSKLEEIANWLKKTSEQEVEEKQELIVTIIALITNEQFQKSIQALRKKYQIPPAWHTTDKNSNLYEDYLEYLNIHPEAPRHPYDKPITDLCIKVGVDIKKHSDFILGYLYYGYTLPLKPEHVDWYQPFYSTDEYRYKANIELDYGDSTEEKEKMEIKKGYIRFYNDTTPNQLVRFIKDNWQTIAKVQAQLKPYQHTKKHSQPKRDIFVYLLHLLGNKSPEIMDKVATEEINYPLDYVEIRQIVCDLKNRIDKITS